MSRVNPILRRVVPGGLSRSAAQVAGRGARAGLGVCLWLMLSPFGATGEQFLSTEEALKVCFPNADAVSEQQVELTADLAKEVTKKAGLRTKPGRYRYWIARKGADVMGVAMEDRALGKHEWIDFMVAMNRDGTVRQVEVLVYREHYGSEVRSPKWRAQFRGKSAGDKFQLNDDVYNLSGATLSCRSVTRGIKRVVILYEEAIRARLDSTEPGAGRLP